MKLSQFNILTKADNDDNTYLVYNTHTTAFVTFDTDKYNEIFVQKNFSDIDVVSELKNIGIIVDDDIDELLLLEEIRKNGMDDPVQNVTILTTTECNARCYYCFENGIRQYDLLTR